LLLKSWWDEHMPACLKHIFVLVLVFVQLVKMAIFTVFLGHGSSTVSKAAARATRTLPPAAGLRLAWINAGWG